jgi:hypothetical protein
MNIEERLRRLGRRARQEAVPEVDVRRSVLAALRRRVAEAPAGVSPLAWVAGLSAAVAVPAGVAAFIALQQWMDPLVSVLLEPSVGL